MKTDPVVAEVRANRSRLFEKCNNDLKRLVADAQSRQANSGHHLVSFVVRGAGAKVAHG